MIQWLSDLLWGYDFFVSYAHRDSPVGHDGRPQNHFVRSLVAQLRANKFSVFHDETEYHPGEDIAQSTIRRVRSSSKLILVARPIAMTVSEQRHWIMDEVKAAIYAGSEIIVVDINRAYADASKENPIKQLIGDSPLRHSETISDPDGDPSTELINRLVKGSEKLRREVRRQRCLSLIGLCLAVLLVISAFQTWSSRHNLAMAEREYAERSQRQNSPYDAIGWYSKAVDDFPWGDKEAEATIRLLDASASTIKHTLPHSGIVRVARYSPDGKVIVTASDDRSARLWDSQTGKPIAGPLKHKREVVAIAFSEDGKLLATGDDGGLVQVWNTSTGQRISGPLAFGNALFTLSFGLEGELIAAGGFGPDVKVWESNTGRLTHDLRDAAVEGNTKLSAYWLGFPSKCSNLIAAFNDGRLFSWDLGKKDGKPSVTKMCKVKIHTDAIRSVDVNRTGTLLITASYDRTARVWGLPSLDSVGSLMSHQDRIMIAKFAPDGNTIATAGLDGEVKFWRAADGQTMNVVLKHRERIGDIAFSPDGTSLAVSDWGGDVRLWKVQDGSQIGDTFNFQHRINSVDFSRDGTSLLVALTDDAACVLNVKPYVPTWKYAKDADDSRISELRFLGRENAIVTTSEKRLSNLIGNSKSTTAIDRMIARDHNPQFVTTMSNDGMLTVIAENGSVSLIDNKTMRTKKTWNRPINDEAPICCRLDPNKQTVLLSSASRLEVFPIELTSPPTTLQLKKPVIDACVGSSSKIIHVLNEDGFESWDSERNVQISSMQLGREWCSGGDDLRIKAIGPDGRIAIARCDKAVAILDAKTGGPLGQLMHHNNNPLAIAISPEGTTIAIGTEVWIGEDNRSVPASFNLWSASAGTSLCEPFPLQQSVEKIVINHTSTIALVITGNEVRRYDLLTKAQVGPPLVEDRPIVAACVNCDGTFIGTANDQGVIKSYAVPIKRQLRKSQRRLWIEVLTARAFDPSTHALKRLTFDEWSLKSKQLNSLGLMSH